MNTRILIYALLLGAAQTCIGAELKDILNEYRIASRAMVQLQASSSTPETVRSGFNAEWLSKFEIAETKAGRSDPLRTSVLREMVALSAALRSYDKAIAFCQRLADEAKEPNVEASEMIILANLYLQQATREKQAESAALDDIFLKAISLAEGADVDVVGTGLLDMYMEYGDILAKRGKTELAVDLANRAVPVLKAVRDLKRRTPYFIDYLFQQKIKWLVEAGKTQDAEKVLDELLESEDLKYNRWYHVYTTAKLIAKDDKKTFCEFLERWKQKLPADPWLYITQFEFAEACFSQRDYITAAIAYGRVLETRGLDMTILRPGYSNIQHIGVDSLEQLKACFLMLRWPDPKDASVLN